jgi:hypothetical protein
MICTNWDGLSYVVFDKLRIVIIGANVSMKKVIEVNIVLPDLSLAHIKTVFIPSSNVILIGFVYVLLIPFQIYHIESIALLSVVVICNNCQELLNVLLFKLLNPKMGIFLTEMEKKMEEKIINPNTINPTAIRDLTRFESFFGLKSIEFI